MEIDIPKFPNMPQKTIRNTRERLYRQSNMSCNMQMLPIKNVYCKIIYLYFSSGERDSRETSISFEPVSEKTNNMGSNINQPVQSQKQARSLKF